MTSSTPASGALWLEGHAPARGKLARARIRSTADIAAIEALAPDTLLPGNTLYECIRAAAQVNPDKAAFTHLMGADTTTPPRVISYRDLLDQVERSASLFKEIAGDQRSVVTIILPMLPEALIAAWGASTAGIANPVNPYLELKQVAAIMNTAKTTVLLTTTDQFGPGVWNKLDELVTMVPTLRKVLLVGVDDASKDFGAVLAARQPGLGFTPESNANAEAVYLPTGGTTAAPKLVRQTHRGQLLNAWTTGAMSGASTEGVVGHAMPNFHVGGCVMLSLRAIIYGQTVLTLTTDGFRNPGIIKNFWDIARHYKMTSLIATPATASAIMAVPNTTSDGHCIQSFNAGGSTVPLQLIRAFHEKFGIWIREVWGMSEIHGAVSGHPDDGKEPVAGSVGVHLPWHPIKAIEVDEKNHFVRECKPGERGVLAIGGPGVTPGYVDSSLDKEFFVQNMPGDLRWANTGDLGVVDENGRVWLFGRAKDVIVRGGHNLDPGMIEEVLISHPAVQLAAAIGKPDAAKGEMPIAYVQLKEGQSAEPAELLDLCKKDVQERAAVPIEIHVVPALPMTAVGKINKPALRVDILRRVAEEVAGGVINGRGTVNVSVDESGKRPCAVIRAQVSDPAAVESALKTAFTTFEFQTRLEVTAA